jgi:hypothetical protein
MSAANDRTTQGADTRSPLGALALVVLATLAVPATALAGPAIDEYTLDLPDAKGNVESPEAVPVANPAALPPDVASRLTRNPSGKALATIATASSLGAPVEHDGGNPSDAGSNPAVGGEAAVAGAQPSTLTAVGNAASDPAAIGLIAVLLGIVGGMLLLRRRAPKA